MTLPFLSMPCSQTPPESPTTIAFCGRLLLPSRFSTLSAPGCVTRLNRFTCVTAWTSLCLRLTHVVASMSPRLDSRWGGSSLSGAGVSPAGSAGLNLAHRLRPLGRSTKHNPITFAYLVDMLKETYVVLRVATLLLPAFPPTAPEGGSYAES